MQGPENLGFRITFQLWTSLKKNKMKDKQNKNLKRQYCEMQSNRPQFSNFNMGDSQTPVM